MLNLTELIGLGIADNGSHKYWRINALVYSSYASFAAASAFIRIIEIRMSEQIGDPAVVPNVCVGGSVTLQDTQTVTGFGAYPGFGTQAQRDTLFDGSLAAGAAYAFNNGYDQFGSGMLDTDGPFAICYSFPAPVNIKQLSWYHNGANLGQESGLVDFDLQWADNINGPWTTVCSPRGLAAGGLTNQVYTTVVETGITTITGY